MIERYNLRIGNDLIDWIEHLIPREDFQSNETTFHVVDVVGSEIIEAISSILKKFGHSDADKRISASTTSLLAFHHIKSENIIDNIFYESNNMDFTSDWVITIPKIEGGSDAALTFMKSSIKRARKGLITMIDSKPILDKLYKPADIKIKEFLKFHMKSAVLIKPSIFGKDSMSMPLAFISLKSFNTEIHFLDLKDSLHGNNKFVIYDSVKKRIDSYDNIDNINIFFGNDETAFSIRQKYINFIEKYGSLESVVDNARNLSKKTNGNYKININASRGHVSSKNKNSYVEDDFYSFYSFNSRRGYGVVTTEPALNEKGSVVARYNEINFNNKKDGINILNYLNSIYAKFGLIWGKYDLTISPSTFKFIPKLDFSKPFNETDFEKLLGLTKKESFWLKSNLVD